MAVYIDRSEAGDLENLSPKVLEYVIKEHQRSLPRLQKLKQYYLAKNQVDVADTDGQQKVIVDYPKYIVNSILGFYLGEPVRYTDNGDDGMGLGSSDVLAKVKDGRVIRHTKFSGRGDAIKAIMDAYKRQTISEVDSEIGKNIGIYGEAYELIYASDDKIPFPKSTSRNPEFSVMVRDTSVEHRKLFFFTYEKRKHLDGAEYYSVYVYTDKSIKHYISTSIQLYDFYPLDEETQPHFFGEVPCVEYQNNSDRLCDYETEINLIDAYNTIMSDRVTDKNKYIDSILALFGMSLEDDDQERLKKYKMLDGLPEDARLEYIQKQFDESSVHILADDLVKEIHKMSMTVDMSDSSFGTASGQALKLKLLAMSMLVKSKIRQMEKGLRKRFEMYNRWLCVQGVMEQIDREDIEPVFTISIPIDEQAIVSMIVQLRGLVDDETLLSQLWFVRDPAAILEKVKKQKKENAENAPAAENEEKKKEEKEEEPKEEIKKEENEE